MTHLLSDPRVVEASLAAVPTTTIGCTCRWDERGNPPDSYRRAERWREYAIKRRREALTAAVAALPRDELLARTAQAIHKCSFTNGDAYDDAKAVLVAIGLIPEHVTATEERCKKP